MSHANAKLNEYCRLLLVSRLKEGLTQAEVAEAQGVARSTVSKWWKRYREEGHSGTEGPVEPGEAATPRTWGERHRGRGRPTVPSGPRRHRDPGPGLAVISRPIPVGEALPDSVSGQAIAHHWTNIGMTPFSSSRRFRPVRLRDGWGRAMPVRRPKSLLSSTIAPPLAWLTIMSSPYSM